VSATLERNLTRPTTGDGLDADYEQSRMTSQLVALPTQSRNASGLDELDELDEEPAAPHMFIKASLQLALSFELVLVLDDEPGRHVPHLAMMLSTAFSHLDEGIQAVTDRTENTKLTSPSFISCPPKNREYIAACPVRSTGGDRAVLTKAVS
jgi:hypothetical protein